MAKQIIETKFNKLIKLIHHAGVGNGASTKECPYGGILRHLNDYIGNSYSANKLVLLLIDSVYDNDSVRSSIKDIRMTIRNKNNIQLLKQQICFELNLISYNNILSMCGKLNNNAITNFREDVMQYQKSKKANTKKLQHIMNTLNTISIEKISKEALHAITQQNKKCLYKGKYIDPTNISGEKMGYCWTKPCCYLNNNTCNNEYYSFKFKRADKIRDIYTYSNYNNILNEIETYIKEYFKSFYHIDTKYEQTFRAKLWKHCKQNTITIYKCIDSYININNNPVVWNYRLICKSLGIK